MLFLIVLRNVTFSFFAPGIQLLSVLIDIIWCSMYGPDSTDGVLAFSFVMTVFCLFLRAPLLFFLFSIMEKRGLPFSPLAILKIETSDDEFAMMTDEDVSLERLTGYGGGSSDNGYTTVADGANNNNSKFTLTEADDEDPYAYNSGMGSQQNV